LGAGVLLLAAPMNQMLLAQILVAIAGAAPIVIWAASARIPRPVRVADGDTRVLPAAV